MQGGTQQTLPPVTVSCDMGTGSHEGRVAGSVLLKSISFILPMASASVGCGSRACSKAACPRWGLKGGRLHACGQQLPAVEGGCPSLLSHLLGFSLQPAFASPLRASQGQLLSIPVMQEPRHWRWRQARAIGNPASGISWQPLCTKQHRRG